MRLRQPLFIAAVLAAFGAAYGARAQELSVDAKLLDPSVAGAKSMAKKGKQQAGAKSDSGKADKGGKVDNRRFGELEGWSPGKSPPGSKKPDEPESSLQKAPVSLTPSGGMAVGMPF